MVKHRRKTKTKIVYRQKSAPSVDYEKKAREELAELKTQRQKHLEETAKLKEGKKGFGRFVVGVRQGLGGAAINQQINAKTQFLQGTQQLRNLKTSAETAKVQNELREMQKKNAITFEDLQGMGSGSKVKFENLY